MTRRSAPKVTVVMPTFDSGLYLTEAIQSVLAQSLPDISLVILDGGSSDCTKSIARWFAKADPRVHLRVMPGLHPALRIDHVFPRIKSDYIAIQHSDDISYSHRLEAQVGFLEAHPDVSVCSAAYRSFWHQRAAPPQVEGASVHHKPTSHEEIRAQLPFWWVMHAPTLIFDRRRAAAQGMRFHNTFKFQNDYWQSVVMSGKLRYANIDRELSAYRIHDASDGMRNRLSIMKEARRLKRAVLDQFGFQFSDGDLKIHAAIRLMPDGMLDAEAADNPDRTVAWLERLAEQNAARRMIDVVAFDAVIRDLVERVQAFARK